MKIKRIPALSAAAISLAFAALTVACQNNSQTKESPLTTDSLTYESKSNNSEVSITVDVPTAGPTPLANIIREYISEELGGTYRNDINNPHSMLAYYGKGMEKNLKDMTVYDNRESMPTLSDSRSISKTYETDKFVVYTSRIETYYGGAHGMHTGTTATFRKSDGRRFGHEMLTGTNTESFKLLIKEGLKEYFKEDSKAPISDEDLKNMLLTEYSVDFLPLPQYAPALGKEGVTFTYQPYEIAPYAAGMPSFTVPYDKILPYLTATITDMIELHD